jgi:hypothetical protein
MQKIIWSGFNSEGYYMHLVAKPKKVSKNVHYIGEAAYDYVLDYGVTQEVSDHLTWLQTLFILQVMLTEEKWKKARMTAEKLALRMQKLDSPADAFYLANWTIQVLSEGEDEK